MLGVDAVVADGAVFLRGQRCAVNGCPVAAIENPSANQKPSVVRIRLALKPDVFADTAALRAPVAQRDR